MPILSTSTAKRRGASGGGGLTITLQKVMLVACQDIITLNAVLSGSPIGPQTYLWEQLTGTPVTWLEDQNQTMVMFQQPTARDDKTFRFYLDKDTPYEQHADILVTLISLESVPAQSLAPLSVQDYLPNQVINGVINNRPAPTALGVVVVNPQERMLSFSLLQNTVNAAYLQLNQLANGVVTPVQQSSVYGTYFRDLELDDTYRIDTVSSVGGLVRSYTGPAINVQTPVNTELALTEAISIGSALRGIDSTLTTFYLSRIQENTPIDPMTAIGASLRGLVVFGEQTFMKTREVYTTPVDDMTAVSTKLRGLTFVETVSQSSYSSIG